MNAYTKAWTTERPQRFTGCKGLRRCDKHRKARSGRRQAVEKPLRGKVQKTDFPTTLGNLPTRRISTFRTASATAGTMVVSDRSLRLNPMTRPSALTYCREKMVLTLGSTINRGREQMLCDDLTERKRYQYVWHAPARIPLVQVTFFFLSQSVPHHRSSTRGGKHFRRLSCPVRME